MESISHSKSFLVFSFGCWLLFVSGAFTFRPDCIYDSLLEMDRYITFGARSDSPPILMPSSWFPMFWGISRESTNCAILDGLREIITMVIQFEQSESVLIRVARLWWTKWNSEREGHSESVGLNGIKISECESTKLERYFDFSMVQHLNWFPDSLYRWILRSMSATSQISWAALEILFYELWTLLRQMHSTELI
jgi:hypothetical protein